MCEVGQQWVLKATLNGGKDASVASGQCPETIVEDKC